LIPMTCPSCGAGINVSSELTKAVCEYCGNSVAIVENKEKDETNTDEHIRITLNLPEEDGTSVDGPIRIRLNLPDEEGGMTTKTYSKITTTTRITVNVTDEDNEAILDGDVENYVKSALRMAQNLRNNLRE